MDLVLLHSLTVKNILLIKKEEKEKVKSETKRCLLCAQVHACVWVNIYTYIM